jgi:hypothetical protein
VKSATDRRSTGLRLLLSRTLRGLVLLAWICVLSLVALGSLDGSLVERISSGAGSLFRPTAGFELALPAAAPSEALVAEGETEATRCPTGHDVYENAPVAALLDVVLPDWPFLKSKNGGCTSAEADQIYESYYRLFTKVEARLRSLAASTGTDPKTLRADGSFLTPEFSGDEARDVPLPLEVQDWILQERERIEQGSQRRSLAGTFLLLSTLGAFGALIFLIRDFITLDQEKTLSDYFFRPVLGVFLAVAIFVIDLFAHAVVSTSSILSIRYEPLYMLALAAGLLSEQAYDLVRYRANSAFDRYREGTDDPKEKPDAGGDPAPTEKAA